ncbi:DUF692 domain-containing protein [Legionella oakridgensis]|uniref:UPF0276 protein Loa_01502 n=2 Tax=Legionella oakridgensis TaxID=29423 RepID=W0B929_9GAMM|nr:DUF692 domain-containing protein [Legionella oakridgensis]AHE67053.1 hypothetical protein Loa_01502 [Legionella oakridgensis ATCC 33761 = DSM 21215]ETO93338.1 hypothetical protein LOR_79c23160 [Legionella oakridgensis RV-2-2007]KTD37203.1 hypothetical protein Loak_2339 [Legionella oakridgensis]STY20147.1 Protein of uncharacterised function (DUF692) [Legionella longbeachae]
MRSHSRAFKPVSGSVGIGLRSQHYSNFLDSLPNIGFLEVHCENYFGQGGKPLVCLEHIANHYPLSFHGVGLSLGSTDGLSAQHLRKLKALIDRFEPMFVSEHLCWGSVEGTYFNDLLPLPYTPESLWLVIKHVHQVQDYLKRPILIENISSYLEYDHSVIPEYEFMMEIIKATGCSILLDVNNLYVNSVNHGWDTKTYLHHLAPQAVQEIHLAGFTQKVFDDALLLIDTHDKPVTQDVWMLYEQSLQYLGPKPTLIEWDANLPDLSILLGEAEKAKRILDDVYAISA